MLVTAALQRQEVRYLLVAGTTTLIYLGMFAAYLTVLPYMWALLAAHACAITVAFPVYRRVVFRSTGAWQRDLPRFVSVWGGGFVAGLAGTPALVELAGMHPLAAQVLTVAVVAVASYTGHRFFTFRR